MAELGIVAASWGTVLVSGSGVLVVGEVGAGFSSVLGFLCRKRGEFSFDPCSPSLPLLAALSSAATSQGTGGPHTADGDEREPQEPPSVCTLKTMTLEKQQA